MKDVNGVFSYFKGLKNVEWVDFVCVLFFLFEDIFCILLVFCGGLI